MAKYGSPEYVLTWKHWDMPSGPQICAQRAAPRPISGSAFTGWPTPVAQDAKNCTLPESQRFRDTIPGQILKGWVSPTVQDHSRGVKPPRPQDTGVPLSQQIGEIMQGWRTPTSEDGQRGIAKREHPRQRHSLDSQVKTMGWSTPTAITDTGGAALCKWGGTASRRRLREAVGNTVLNGALNPAFPCWLMGYPDAWLSCADSAMQSFRKSRRNLSKPTLKQPNKHEHE